MTAQPPSDRRRSPRIDGARLAVSLRPRGRLNSLQAEAVDFSRHGIAVRTAVALDKDRTVYLSLCCDGMRLDNLVGVVHNCVRQGGAYRCGIRFRPTSELQHDRVEVEALLTCLEDAVGGTWEASA